MSLQRYETGETVTSHAGHKRRISLRNPSIIPSRSDVFWNCSLFFLNCSLWSLYSFASFSNCVGTKKSRPGRQRGERRAWSRRRATQFRGFQGWSAGQTPHKPSSVQFSRSVVSDSLLPHELQHARPPCPSPTPRVHPNPCQLSW